MVSIFHVIMDMENEGALSEGSRICQDTHYKPSPIGPQALSRAFTPEQGPRQLLASVGQ